MKFIEWPPPRRHPFPAHVDWPRIRRFGLQVRWVGLANNELELWLDPWSAF